MIEKVALDLGHTICGYFSASSPWDLETLSLADVCIEFTEPNAVLENIKKLVQMKKNIVVGTTGWYQNLDEVQSYVDQHQTGLVYSSNFSLGVNIYLEVLNQAARLFNPFPEYDVAGIEYHHNQKKDSPSGTSETISQIIENGMPRIDQLHFSSVRCGSIPGRHSILFDSPFDTITISHEARNREGFALGAIQAANWIKGRKGCFTFSDCIESLISKCKNFSHSN